MIQLKEDYGYEDFNKNHLVVEKYRTNNTDKLQKKMGVHTYPSPQDVTFSPRESCHLLTRTSARFHFKIEV